MGPFCFDKQQEFTCSTKLGCCIVFPCFRHPALCLQRSHAENVVKVRKGFLHWKIFPAFVLDLYIRVAQVKGERGKNLVVNWLLPIFWPLDATAFKLKEKYCSCQCLTSLMINKKKMYRIKIMMLFIWLNSHPLLKKVKGLLDGNVGRVVLKLHCVSYTLVNHALIVRLLKIIIFNTENIFSSNNLNKHHNGSNGSLAFEFWLQMAGLI